MRASFLILSLSLIVLGCSKEDPKWSSLELVKRMQQNPGGATEVVMTEANTPVSQCVGYGQRCLPQTGKIFQLCLVSFIAVEFASTEDAWFAARKLGQYYSRNWLFDDVSGEPSAEKFVITRFNARRPDPKEEILPQD